MPKIGVVLAGSGVQDGSEIHEAVLTLLAINKRNAEYVIMAPNKEQAHVVNHLSGDESKGEKRNVLVESARIARGNIKDIKTIKAKDIDALVFPGGFGAAKNLCTFAFDGSNCKVDTEVERLLREMHAAGKPIGAICITPVIIAKVFGKEKAPQVTIGKDASTAKAIEIMGAKHISVATTAIVIDKVNKIVTTPAYMSAQRINEVAIGIDKLVGAVIDLI
jgi:enhancing lycopene biosynthesis protein 2